MKVVIIDDNVDLANSLRDALNNYSKDYECFSFYDGNSALGFINNNPPDVIFTDIILPDLSGLNILKSVKELDSDIQVIIMTAYASLSTSIEALEYGAFDYIPKPLHINQVMNALKSAINKRKSLLENKKIIASLLNKKDENISIKDEGGQIIQRLIVLKQFQKKISGLLDGEKLFETSYQELTKIFTTKFVYFFIKTDDNFFEEVYGPDVGEFKKGEKVDINSPLFFVPLKNSMGCIFADSKSMVSIMTFENKVVGLIYLKREGGFTESDLELSELLSLIIVSGYFQIKLKKKLESTKYGIVYTMLILTGINDSSQKKFIETVSNYCENFARFLKLDNDRIERIKYSSILFNIIQEIEKNNQKENKDKFLSRKFKSIIKDIEFLKDLEEIVNSVSENYDGSGFPKKLKGDQIPIESQIIKIVNTYVLLTETKDYRDRLDEKIVLRNLEDLSGKYFDKKLIEKFKVFVDERKIR